MTKNLLKISMLTLLAAAVAALPMQLSAQTTNTPPPKKKMNGHPFRGKVAALDATAMTFKVGETTYEINSTSRITKNGKPATLTDAVVGDDVTGYARDEDGKMIATTVRFGIRPPKKAPPPADTSTNAAPK